MKKRNLKATIMFYTLFLLCYLIIGLYAGAALAEEDTSIWSILIVLTVIPFYILSIFVHEFGHMIFGLLTGYKFLSFRIFNLVLLNNNGKLEFKKMSIAGTGGQCIMLPKENNNKFVLYNLGGILLNIVFFIISIILFIITKNIYIKIMIFEFGLFNLFNSIINGIPFKDAISNDMQNIIEFKKDKRNLDNYFNALYIQNEISLGKRLKDIDKKYLYKPEKLEVTGDVLAMVFYCNKLMDENKFDEAITSIESIIDHDKLEFIYRALLINDLLYCYIILDKNPDKILNMEDNDIKKILKQMKDYPSVIRTNYTYALLGENNQEEANELLNSFNKVQKTFPNQTEVDSEMELIEIARNKYQEKDQ